KSDDSDNNFFNQPAEPWTKASCDKATSSSLPVSAIYTDDSVGQLSYVYQARSGNSSAKSQQQIMIVSNDRALVHSFNNATKQVQNASSSFSEIDKHPSNLLPSNTEAQSSVFDFT